MPNSTTVTDENFDALYNAGQLKAQTPTMDTEEAFDERYAREHPETPPGVVKPETPVGQEPPPKDKPEQSKTLQGYLSEQIAPFYNFLADENKIGMAGVHEGEEGFAAQRGAQSYEDAEAHLEDDKAQVINTQKKVDAFRDQNAAYHAFSFVGPAAQMMPMLTHLAGVYGVGFAAGVPTGAAVGAVVGAPTGAGEALTVPAAALANGALGGDAAVFTATAALMGGNKYMQLRREGHSHDEASTYSTALGLVQGAFGSLRFGQTAGVFRNAVAKAAEPLMVNAIKQYAKGLGIQGGLGALNESANLAVDTALAFTSGKKGESPSFNDVAARLSKATFDAVQQAAVFNAAAEGTAAVVRPWVKPKSVPQTLRVLKQMAKNPDADLALLPSPEPPKPVVLKEEIPTRAIPIELRSKGEIARDEARKVLHGQISEVSKASIKAEETYKAAAIKVENLRHERSNKEELADAKVSLETAKEEYRFSKETEDTLKEKVEKLEEAHHETEMKRLLKAVASTASPIKNGMPDSRIARGTDIQSVLNRVRGYVKHQEEAEKAIAEYQTAASENKVTPEQQMNYEAATLVRNLKDKTSIELRHLTNDIVQAHEVGKAGRLIQLADKAEARHELVAKWREAAQGKNPVESDVNPESKPKHLKLGSVTSPGALNFFGNYLSKPKFILHEATNRDALLKEVGVRDILTTVDKQVMDNEKMLMGHLTQATGKTPAQINELIRLGAKKRISITVYTGGKEGITELPKQSEISINQAMDKLAQLEDPEAERALIEGNKFMADEQGTYSTKQELIDKLTAEDPAYAKMPKAYMKAYAELHPRLAKEYKNTTGEEMPRNPNYSGTIRHEKNNSPGQQEFEATLQSRRTAFKTGTAAKPSATKARTGDRSPLAYEDIHNKFNRYSRQTEHYIGFNEFSKEVLGPIARDPELGRIVDRKHGSALMRSWREDVSDVIYGNSDKKTAWGDWINTHLLKNTSITMLSGKPLMFLKHTLSFMTAANHLPTGALAKGVYQFYRNPIKNSRDLVKTKEYMTRHGKEDLNTAATSQMPEDMKAPFFSALDHWAMSPTIYGIKGTDLAILYAARQHYMAKGLTESEALAKGGEILHNTQVSSGIDMSSNLTRSSAGKLVTMFQGQVTNLATETYLAWDRAFVLPTKENITYAVKTSIVSATSLAIFEGVNAAWKYATAADDKDREESIFEASMKIGFGMIPIINYPLVKDLSIDASTIAINRLFDVHHKVPEQSSLVAGFVTETLKTFDNILHASVEPDWGSEHVMDLIIGVNDFIGITHGSVLGSPLHTIKHLNKMNQ